MFSRVGSVGYTGTQAVVGGRTEYKEVPDTEVTKVPIRGTEVVPNLPECRVPVSRSYRRVR